MNLTVIQSHQRCSNDDNTSSYYFNSAATTINQLFYCPSTLAHQIRLIKNEQHHFVGIYTFRIEHSRHIVEINEEIGKAKNVEQGITDGVEVGVVGELKNIAEDSAVGGVETGESGAPESLEYVFHRFFGASSHQQRQMTPHTVIFSISHSPSLRPLSSLPPPSPLYSTSKCTGFCPLESNSRVFFLIPLLLKIVTL